MARSAIGQAGSCPFCRSTVRLVAPRFHTPDDTFTHWLIIAQGPVREGEQLLIGGPGPIEIGKAGRKPLFLPGNLVSRSHARLRRTKNGWRIDDENSTNGIFINGEKTPGAELADGDVIQIGEYLLQFHSDEPVQSLDASIPGESDPVARQKYLREHPHPVEELERLRAQLIIAFNPPTSRSSRKWLYAIALLIPLAAATIYWRLHHEVPVLPYSAASRQDLQWFGDAKLGIMVTWGPASLTGKEISWSRAATRPGEEKSGIGDIPVGRYDTLYQHFNPTQFNARGCIDLFRRAGARYVVFVTKHHDGFCMFDSRLTDYSITHTPYGKDSTAEIAEACRTIGMKLGIYYSLPDWRQRDYLTPTHNRYLPYLYGQIHELCIGYGPIDLFWFDGLHGRAKDWDAQELFRTIRRLQPHALINNGCGLEADFDVRDEIGGVQTTRPWELRWPIASQLSYKPDDRPKPLSQCLATLLRVAGSGGNLLLNIGPRPDGLLDPAQLERLLQIGDWLRRYGASVYDTRPGPWRPGPWGAATQHGRIIYLHVLDAGARRLELPAIDREIRSAEMITGGTVRLSRTGNNMQFHIEPSEGKDPPWTIRLEMDAAYPGMMPE